MQAVRRARVLRLTLVSLAAVAFSLVGLQAAPGVAGTAPTLAAARAVAVQTTTFPADIDGRTYRLEARVYRTDAPGRRPLAVVSHGRNGMFPPRNLSEVNGCAEFCTALAAEHDAVVVFFVRRGYGNSEGSDVELQDTAVHSGLEAAKDFQAAVAYWRTRDFVDPARVVVMGQSQGGWDTLACSTVPMAGVLGCVNLSGGTNYATMGTGAVTRTVQDHWVAGCAELGRLALTPTFWIYSENDLSISGPTARRMFEAFTGAGGWGYLTMLPAYGANGHAIVGAPGLFLPQLGDFLATVVFLDEPAGAPGIVAVTGGGSYNAGADALLVVSLTANPLPALQWRKDGVDLRNGGDIAGATSSALTIANVQAIDAGSYTVVATNTAGVATSAPVVIALATTPTTPTGPTPPTTPPTPAKSGGGGGGAPSPWLLAALGLLLGARRFLRARRGSSPSTDSRPEPHVPVRV